MSEEWKVVPGYYPGFLEIVGASYKVSIVTTATDLDFEDFCNRTRDVRIMAAAKDMLLSLEGLTREGFEPDYGSDKLGAIWVTAGEWKIIKAAIAKARGNV